MENDDDHHADRAVKVLDALEKQQIPLKAGSLAKLAGEKKGTHFNRLLYAMKDRGLIEREHDTASPAVWQLVTKKK
jgi:DNA-binding IclR family transcriptional regulator